MPDDCLFCKIASGKIPSAEVYSDDEFYAFRDIQPKAPTHILIVPRRHIPTIADITPEDAALVGRLFLKANDIARSEGIAENGFRYVLNCGRWGGQEVIHVHLHLLGGRPMKGLG